MPCPHARLHGAGRHRDRRRAAAAQSQWQDRPQIAGSRVAGAACRLSAPLRPEIKSGTKFMSLVERQLPVHAPMNQFSVRDGELVVGGERLSLLTARVGQTPFYAYERSLMRARVAELRDVLPKTVKLHYAMKANPMPAVVGLMAGLVDGIDVASAGELKVALDAGANPLEISFAGPGKRDAELRQAVASRVLINLESFREVAA